MGSIPPPGMSRADQPMAPSQILGELISQAPQPINRSVNMPSDYIQMVSCIRPHVVQNILFSHTSLTCTQVLGLPVLGDMTPWGQLCMEIMAGCYHLILTWILVRWDKYLLTWDHLMGLCLVQVCSISILHIYETFGLGRFAAFVRSYSLSRVLGLACIMYYNTQRFPPRFLINSRYDINYVDFFIEQMHLRLIHPNLGKKICSGLYSVNRPESRLEVSNIPSQSMIYVYTRVDHKT